MRVMVFYDIYILKSSFTNSLKKSGLKVRLFEDCGHIFKDMLGQMIIDHGIAKNL